MNRDSYIALVPRIERLTPLELAAALFTLDQQVALLVESTSYDDYAGELWEWACMRLDDLGTWNVDTLRSGESNWRKFRSSVNSAYRHISELLWEMDAFLTSEESPESGHPSNERLIHSHLRLGLQPSEWRSHRGDKAFRQITTAADSIILLGKDAIGLMSLTKQETVAKALHSMSGIAEQVPRRTPDVVSSGWRREIAEQEDAMRSCLGHVIVRTGTMLVNEGMVDAEVRWRQAVANAIGA